MCSIFGNMPPVFRRPAHLLTPQYAAAAYTPNATTNNGYQHPQQQPPVYQGGPTSSTNSQYPSYATPDDANALFGTTAQPMRQDDRSVSLKVELTSKLQYELERMFKRIRGKRVYCGMAPSLFTHAPLTTLTLQTTLTSSLSTSSSSRSHGRQSSEGSSRSRSSVTTSCGPLGS